MVSRWFIINEWLLDNLLDNSRPEEQERSVHFLEALIRSPDGIIVLWNSPWMEKAWELMEKDDEERRQISILFQTRLVRHLSKFKWLMDYEVKELPDILQNLLNEGKIDRDDVYLFQTWLSSPVKVEYIVTSDKRLMQALAEHWSDIKTRHRDDFLTEYLGTAPAQ